MAWSEHEATGDDAVAAAKQLARSLSQPSSPFFSCDTTGKSSRVTQKRTFGGGDAQLPFTMCSRPRPSLGRPQNLSLRLLRMMQRPQQFAWHASNTCNPRAKPPQLMKRPANSNTRYLQLYPLRTILPLPAQQNRRHTLASGSNTCSTGLKLAGGIPRRLSHLAASHYSQAAVRLVSFSI